MQKVLFMRRFVIITFRMLVILAVLGFAIYRLQFAPIAVTAVEVRRGPVTAEVMGTGTLTAHTKATVSPKIQGRLMTLTVDQNDTVTTGQLLATLDDSDLREQVAIAKANLDAAQATLDRVQADDARAKAVVTQARLDYKRFDRLGTTSAVSTSDVDKSRESMQVAEAGVVSAAAATIEARKQMASIERSLRYQETKLADTKIHSPFAGLITRRDRDVGDIIVPGASIFQLVSTNEIWVSAWVDESAMGALQPGQSARIVFRSDPLKLYSGRVIRVGREVDRETREFLVDLSAEELPRGWAIGQRAEVFIQTGKKDNVVQVPRKLVRWREGNAGVFVIADGKASWRNLKLGMAGGEIAEIESGLAAGDKVISALEADAQKLQPGRRVVIHP